MKATEFQRIAVLGAGTMGHGIALVAATAGLEVQLFDIDEASVTRGAARLRSALDEGVARGKLTPEARDAAWSRVVTTTTLAAAVSQADAVIEAVPERMDLKRPLFEAVAQHAPAQALLGTNTSSLSIRAIADAAGARASRVVGLHFFNPPHLVKLLEIVRSEVVAVDAMDDARALGERLGREMIVVSDSPGFATSRLGVVLGLEAMRMVEQGVASARDIDTAMRLGYGHKMGPLEVSDLVGLDVRLAIAEYLHAQLGGEQYRPPEILRRLVNEGALGKKSGQGFHLWSA